MVDVLEMCIRSCQCRKWCNRVSLDFGLLTLQTGLNMHGVGKKSALARTSLMAAKATVALSFQGTTMVLYLEAVTTC